MKSFRTLVHWKTRENLHKSYRLNALQTHGGRKHSTSWNFQILNLRFLQYSERAQQQEKFNTSSMNPLAISGTVKKEAKT